ncbi:raffinose/stachyose/melibiose transport system permease protein [Arthrobacter sp. 1088]|uniref:carbohydrate ABC transporter permease n=2 Tax=unclassified Arthrobacter TaxID=235627 RepID=UPI002855A1FA|nr:carbohydrate ABC transporter permease [Arthrobacter sp. 1088]MDR6686096.1 raffinose/stachyose/melibiose transport system permease protein [Arthrobacter sp. 1088]
MSTVLQSDSKTAPVTPPGHSMKAKQSLGSRVRRLNIPGGLGGWIWLAIIIVPIYYIVITSLKTSEGYFGQNPLALPTAPTLENYQLVLEANFTTYFMNSVIVTLGSVIPTVLISFMAAFAIVRGRGRYLKFVNGMFLMGLAIPLQATIIPIYLMIIRLNLYDSLLAIMLPSVAFAIPLTVLILSNFIRDVPNELFESMRLDGCSDWQTMWRLALPLTRPAIVTVAIYNGLHVWNGFLLPLVLTQSPGLRVLPLGLWTFQGEFSVNIPAVLASVVLSTLPILVIYVLGRRQLVSGLTAGFSK